jgi:hypothetical protein
MKMKKQKLKKIIPIALSLIMILIITACGNNDDTPHQTPPSRPSNETEVSPPETEEEIPNPNNNQTIENNEGRDENKDTEEDYPTPPEEDFEFGRSLFEGGVFLIRYTGDLQYIRIPDTVEYQGHTYHVRGIGSNDNMRSIQFNENLLGVILPNRLKKIADGTFKDTSLTSIVIPESVVIIGNEAFLNTGLTEITFLENPDIASISFGPNTFLGTNLPEETKEFIYKITMNRDEEEARAFFNFN